MKKLKGILLIAMLCILASSAYPQNPVLISVSANYLCPSDSNYRAIYGASAFFPDFTVGARIYRSFYLLGSFGLLAKKGITPELQLPAQSQQKYLSANLGYIGRISENFSWMVDWGTVLVFYKEEALGISATGSKPGFNAEVGLLWDKEDSHLFGGLKAGYLSARDQRLGIKLGGFKIGLCIGFK